MTVQRYMYCIRVYAFHLRLCIAFSFTHGIRMTTSDRETTQACLQADAVLETQALPQEELLQQLLQEELLQQAELQQAELQQELLQQAELLRQELLQQAELLQQGVENREPVASRTPAWARETLQCLARARRTCQSHCCL
jgi:hypothetical protein